MAAFDVYSQQLFSLNNGLALYEPDPAGKYDRVRVGDVGHVMYGGFHRLFNIFLPADDPVNQRGVPEYYEPLPVRDQETFKRSPKSPGALCSASVSTNGGCLRVSGSVVQAGASIELSCSNRQGAALVIQYPAYTEDSTCRRALARYMLNNYRTWITFARDVLNRDVMLRDLVLVTGCDMTANWATATFTQRTMNGSISFQAGDPLAVIGNAELSFWGSWQTSISVPHRCGPHPVDPPKPENMGEVAQIPRTPNFNQCIFIRTFRVQERPMFLPNVIKAEAGPEDLGKEHPPDEMMPITSNSELDLKVEKQDDSWPPHEPIPDKVGELYGIVLGHILERTKADVAILHDDDVSSIMMTTSNDHSGSEPPFLQSFYHRVGLEEGFGVGFSVGRLCGNDGSNQDHLSKLPVAERVQRPLNTGLETGSNVSNITDHQALQKFYNQLLSPASTPADSPKASLHPPFISPTAYDKSSTERHQNMLQTHQSKHPRDIHSTSSQDASYKRLKMNPKESLGRLSGLSVTSTGMHAWPIADSQSDSDSDREQNVEGGTSGENPKPRLTGLGACDHCKRLKMKCDFSGDSNTCRRCLNGGHHCVRTRRTARSATSKREYLLNQIKKQESRIQELMEQLEAANNRVPGNTMNASPFPPEEASSGASYYPTPRSSDPSSVQSAALELHNTLLGEGTPGWWPNMMLPGFSWPAVTDEQTNMADPGVEDVNHPQSAATSTTLDDE